MKSIILAAGYATRLYPLTENFPKPLLKVGDKTILDWLVDDADINAGIQEFVVIANHKFAEHFRTWAAEKLQRITVLDDGTTSNETRLGAVRDIEFALREADLDDDLLIMAGDNVLDFSLSGFVQYGIEKGCSCVMCHEENDPKKQRKTAIITQDETGRITSYEEKPQFPKGNLAVPPFYIYMKEDAGRVTEALASGCGADAPGSFAAWLSRKTAMYAYKMPGKRYDIGDLQSYEQAKTVFAHFEVDRSGCV